jgi:hypothetical protein
MYISVNKNLKRDNTKTVQTQLCFETKYRYSLIYATGCIPRKVAEGEIA